MAKCWGKVDRDGSEVLVLPTIEDAVSRCREIIQSAPGREGKVLVTGSVHLVGGVLEVLETEGKRKKP